MTDAPSPRPDRPAPGSRRLPPGIEPSLYAADLLHLGDQIHALLAAGTTAFHVDVGDGHFIEPIALGAGVVAAAAPVIHGGGAVIDCHLMVDEPERQIDQFADAGADHLTFHLEAAQDPAATIARIHDAGMGAGVAIKPETTVDAAVDAAATADMVLSMSVHPGLSGQAFLPAAVDRVVELRRRLPPSTQIQVDGGISLDNVVTLADAGAELFVAGSSVFWHGDPAVGFGELRTALDSRSAP